MNRLALCHIWLIYQGLDTNVNLIAGSQRVEQQVALYVDLHAFSDLSTVEVHPRSDSHLSSGVDLVKIFFCWSRL